MHKAFKSKNAKRYCLGYERP